MNKEPEEKFASSMSRFHLTDFPPKGILDAFTAALRHVVEVKPIDRVRIRELSEASGFSSRTFYNYFRNKYDLLMWRYDADDCELNKTLRLGSPIPAYEDLFRRRMQRIWDDRAMFRALLSDWSQEDSFCAVSIDHANVKCAEYLRLRGVETIDERLHAVMRHYYAGNAYMTGRWIVAANPAPVEVFCDTLLAAMPPELADLLLLKKQPNQERTDR